MLYSIQTYRAIAVLLVALFHGTNMIGSKYGLVPLNGLFSSGFAGVNLFFVLSGFIILTAHIKDVDNPKQLAWYIKRRLIRIYPFYWIILILLGGWKLISIEPNLEDFFSNALFFQAKVDFVISVAWTLKYEIIFYAMFMALILNSTLGILLLSSWLIYILLSWGTHSHSLAHPFNLLFIFGLLGSIIFFQLKKIEQKSVNIISSSCFILGISLFVLNLFYYSTLSVNIFQWSSHPVSILGFGFASTLMIIGAASTSIEKYFKEKRFLILIGNASYSIYLVHMWGEKNAIKLVKAFNPNLFEGVGESQIVSMFLLFFIVSFAVILGILLHLKIEQPLLTLLRKKMHATKSS